MGLVYSDLPYPVSTGVDVVNIVALNFLELKIVWGEKGYWRIISQVFLKDPH